MKAAVSATKKHSKTPFLSDMGMRQFQMERGRHSTSVLGRIRVWF
jgi:hypothetical protein